MAARYRIALVDDQLSAKPSADAGGYNREMFLADVGTEMADFAFCDGWDPMRKAYTPQHALRQLRAIEHPLDLIIVDLVFGPEVGMGLECIERINEERAFSGVPVLLMSSRSREEEVVFRGERRKLKSALRAASARYLNKENLFKAGMFWRRIEDAIASGANEQRGET